MPLTAPLLTLFAFPFIITYVAMHNLFQQFLQKHKTAEQLEHNFVGVLSTADIETFI